MSELSISQNAKLGSVRVVDQDGEPWFVAKDVAVALKYPESSIASMHKLTGHVPAEWKGRNKVMTSGGMQELLTLSEQGLYFFPIRSDKPDARSYRKWIAGDVVPALRKTGHYGTPPVALPDLTNPAESARAWADGYEAKMLAGGEGLPTTY